MFVELLPILRNRPLMLTLALAGDNAILVNVIPKRLKDSNSGDDALTTPLTVTGTPDELDREFAGQLVGFTDAFVKLGSNLAEIEAAHATAVKAVEAEKKKEIENKRKGSILRGITKDGKPEKISTFTAGLNTPFGIAFYPPGPHPQWVYIGNTASVIRLPYTNGDFEATGPAETIIPELPNSGHATRDLAFSLDGSRLFVAVGSRSNVDDADTHPAETRRANILEYTPTGQFMKIYASGIRNPVGIAVNPLTGELWCSVNERDELGDNLVPDYITHVQEGGFYCWPWFYTGGNQDPRHEGKHPELKGHVIVPDVLLQPHSASLEMVFYGGKQFPEEYRGDIFAAEHGSWNKAVPAGYEVVRVPLTKGHATGEYEDFLTGFLIGSSAAWGRPVGVEVAHDGSLMVTDDASKSIWRVTYAGK